jgi:prepilin-type N-terminal cleavage/methylation domain-containing protein
METPGGFTLIELLVVITIIVVLLALLTPALDQAIYQTELTMCGTNQHALGASLNIYAMDYKRRYPYRAAREVTWRITMISDPNNHYDDRVLLRPYVSINKHLQCPMAHDIDMDGSPITSTRVHTPYLWWAGWQYKPKNKPQQGLLKLGDRLSWQDPQDPTDPGHTFDALVCDRDFT